jgi:hypothetical protein
MQESNQIYVDLIFGATASALLSFLPGWVTTIIRLTEFLNSRNGGFILTKELLGHQDRRLEEMLDDLGPVPALIRCHAIGTSFANRFNNYAPDLPSVGRKNPMVSPR